MKDHLTLDEINQAILKSPQSLRTDRYNHFKGCDACQKEYLRQNSANTILSDLSPKPAPASVAKNVLSQLANIVPSKIKEKTDWTFLIAIILLFAIGSWFLFSGKAESYFKQYAPSTVVEKEQQVQDFTIIDSIREFLSTKKFDLPDMNFGNYYLALGALAVLFYILIDKKISRNYKVHKT